MIASLLAALIASAAINPEPDAIWEAEPGHNSAGPRQPTYVQRALGPECAACAPPVRLAVRCQREPDEEAPTHYLQTLSERGRGDSHPRTVVVEYLTGKHIHYWKYLAVFDPQVYDNGTWLGPALDTDQMAKLRQAHRFRVTVAGEGERRVEIHRATGLNLALQALDARCRPPGTPA